jgi:membrane protease YdiL (CAAX protease family)
MVFIYHAFSFSFLEYLIPLFLITAPFLLQKKIKASFRGKDILTGLMLSVALLAPFGYFMSRVSEPFSLPSVSLILIQLFGISLPEEVYFRGFLQERLGNAMSGLVIVSALFSLMHVPQFIFYGDIYPILTFFPSLVMGFLYMKTSNIVPSTIFHFSANILWLGFSVT